MAPTKKRLDDNLAFQIYRLNVSMRRAFEEELFEQGVTVSQWAVLTAVDQGGCDTATKVRKELGLDRAAVSRAVHELLDAKLVKRKVDRSDRRVNRLMLTPLAKRVLKKHAKTSQAYNRSILAALPASQRKRIIADLAKVGAHASLTWGP